MPASPLSSGPRRGLGTPESMEQDLERAKEMLATLRRELDLLIAMNDAQGAQECAERIAQLHWKALMMRSPKHFSGVLNEPDATIGSTIDDLERALRERAKGADLAGLEAKLALACRRLKQSLSAAHAMDRLKEDFDRDRAAVAAAELAFARAKAMTTPGKK